MTSPFKNSDAAAGEMLLITELRTENQINPVGIDSYKPGLSWQLHSSARGARQSAYQIRVAASEADLRVGKDILFDSGRVPSAQSVDVEYAGSAPQSRHRYVWQVRGWDAQHHRSAWSECASWEMGLLSVEDWTAKWIDPAFPDDPVKSGPAPMLRREFSLRGQIARARAYVTALGLYELYLNGERVGDQLFTPGWTSYNNRVYYQTYDITAQLKGGRNVVGAILGDGWYRGMLGWKQLPQRRHFYGDSVALLAQIEVVFDDGRTETIISDHFWKAFTGPILFSDLYNGETYDARREHAGWASAGYNDGEWSKVKVREPTRAKLSSPPGTPIRRIQEITPIRIFITPAGTTVADMGQNMVGWVRLRVQGPAGTIVTLRHAEVLDENGNIYTDNLRTAQQVTRYILKGMGTEVFEPHFTYQGFRYVGVDGYPGMMTSKSLTGIVIHSDMTMTGRFESSNKLINQLQHNIVWSQKGNFVGIPTDCPQRDERLGWTGDAQVFSATAAFNMDVARFFKGWLQDLSVEQTAQGAVPWTVPNVHDVVALDPAVWKRNPDLQGKTQIEAAGLAGWSDAATVVPWNLYVAYGDKRILADQFESMSRWVAFQQDHSRECIWTGDFQLGDWLDFSADREGWAFGATDDDLVATAYFAHSVDIVGCAATVLQKSEDMARYAALSSQIRSAFVRAFVDQDGKVGNGTQTAYVLALDFDLLPVSTRPLAARRLADDVRARGHLTTGFLGTPHLLNVLTRFGYLEEAYSLINRAKFPSWLYPVICGATTIWERWDGIVPDGSLNNPEMNSFNHYAYGAVGEWMYRVVAGINPDPARAGYKQSVIAPQPGGGLTHAKGSLVTRYGLLSSEWALKEGVFQLTVKIPPNTAATVRLPHANGARVREGDQAIDLSSGVSSVLQEGGTVVVELASGTYKISYPWEILCKQ